MHFVSHLFFRRLILSTQKWKNLGFCCRNFREKKGLSQADIAKIFNGTRQQVSFYEQGFSNSTMLTCAYIKAGIDVTELVRAYEAD